MSERFIYAHSVENRPEAQWQRLEDHLFAVAELARKFASAFDAGDWGYLASLWHGLGKYSGEIPEIRGKTYRKCLADRVTSSL